MSIDILKEDLKQKKIKNLYLFYGPEEYLKYYYLDAIEKLLLKAEFMQLNKIVLEGKLDQGRLIDNCETLPVFSEKKLVVVKDSNLFKAAKSEGKGKSKAKDGGDILTAFLENTPEHTCLIFLEQEIDKRLKLVDIIKKYGLLVEFGYQKPAELVKWVIKAFKSYKKTIDSMAAAQLVENNELGMNELLNEISKLVQYTGGRNEINAEDIESVCVKSVKGRVFDLTDAIAEKNGMLALKYLNDMIILKEPLPKILYMITRQFRHILEMKLLVKEGMSSAQAASKMGITPYGASKAIKQAESFETGTLKKALEKSLEYDLAIKTGRINDRIALELMISEFCK